MQDGCINKKQIWEKRMFINRKEESMLDRFSYILCILGVATRAQHFSFIQITTDYRKNTGGT